MRSKNGTYMHSLFNTRKRIALLEEELASLRSTMAAIANTQEGMGFPATDEPTGRSASRRALLRVGGIGVVAAAASVATSMRVSHAAGGAGDGTNVVQGSANVNTSSTGTILKPVAATSPVALLTVDNSASTSTDQVNASGVTGIGPANTNGVIGISKGANATGVWGESDSGVAVAGQSGTGVDLGAYGTGLFFVHPQTTVGAPNITNSAIGLQVVDSAGDLWICVAAGSPGTWRRAAAVQSGFVGGAANFLSAPIRIFDSRSGQPAPQPTTKAPLAGGSTTMIQVTNVVVGGLSVPKGATGVIGNVTAVAPQGGGNLILYPFGAPRPLTSNLNYAAGEPVAGNFALVGLGSNGAIDLYVNGWGTDVVFDIAGFIM